MNLAFCLFKYFPYGGLQRDFLRIAEECVRNGHVLDVYTMHWEGEMNNLFQVHLIPVKGKQNHIRSKYFVKALHPIFAKKKYDLIVGFNKMPGLDIYYAADTCFQAKARKKHGLWYRLTPRYRHLLAYEKAIFNETSKTIILLLSPSQKSEFIKYYETPKNRFHLLPPGIAKDRIAPFNAKEIRQVVRKEFHSSENDFFLLMIGSGFKTKGLDRILIGLASLPLSIKKRTQLAVVGKDRPTFFQKLAKKLRIENHIHFLGGRDDIPDLLLGADLLLHPAYNENTGTVLLEALASGLPVLTTDVCGYAEYVQKANAGIVLTSPFCQKTFNESLLNMLLSTERSLWQKNAIHFAKEADIYSLPVKAARIIESIGNHRATLHSARD